MKLILSLILVLLLALSAACAAAPVNETAIQTQTIAETSTPEPTQEAVTIEELKDQMKQYVTDGDYANALLCADKMLEIDPESEDAYYAQTEMRILFIKSNIDQLSDMLEKGAEHVNDPAGYTEWVSRYLENTDFTVNIPFTSDYASQDEINTVGITSGNQTNSAKYNGIWRGGLLTWQGGWAYLSCPGEDFAIYKMRTDGSEYQRVGEACGSSLNIIGDWIYYINFSDYKICRVRTDGSMNETISENECSFLSVSGDWMYYDNGNDGGCLYKTRLDGSESVKLSPGTAIFACVVDEYVYYCEKSMEGGLSRVSVDGGEPEHIVSGFIQNYCVVGNWLYYIDTEYQYAIRQVNIDGTQDEELLRIDSVISTFNISEDTIFLGCGTSYEEDNFFITEEIITFDLATLTEKLRIKADTEPLCLVEDGLVLFLKFEEGLAWYVMDRDGSVTKIG